MLYFFGIVVKINISGRAVHSSQLTTSGSSLTRKASSAPMAFVLLAALFVAASAFAQSPASVSPTPSLLPVVPPGLNAAAYAVPREEWIERVILANKRAQEKANLIDLIFDGDSITDYWPSNGQKVWNDRYGKLNTFNFAIAGDRTQHLLWRLGHGQADGLHPKLIAIMIGTNNLDSNTPEEIAGGIKAIVAEYQRRCPGAVILLQAVLPRDQNSTDPDRAKIKKINEIISRLGDGQKVIYIDFGDKFLNADGTMNRDLLPDTIHPSAKGYELWANAIQPIVDKYVSAK